MPIKNPNQEVQNYLSNLAVDRVEAFEKLRQIILQNTTNLVEEISYGMIGYVVPHTVYPDGYHCNPKLPLPFISIASQKNSINFYHMGLYANPELHHWFITEYSKHSTSKLDIGKSCIRFKKWNTIPFDLIRQLCENMTSEQWIALYEKEIKK